MGFVMGVWCGDGVAAEVVSGVDGQDGWMNDSSRMDSMPKAILRLVRMPHLKRTLYKAPDRSGIVACCGC